MNYIDNRFTFMEWIYRMQFQEAMKDAIIEMNESGWTCSVKFDIFNQPSSEVETGTLKYVCLPEEIKVDPALWKYN